MFWLVSACSVSVDVVAAAVLTSCPAVQPVQLARPAASSTGAACSVSAPPNVAVLNFAVLNVAVPNDRSCFSVQFLRTRFETDIDRPMKRVDDDGSGWFLLVLAGSDQL